MKQKIAVVGGTFSSESDISKNSARAKVITEDEAGVKELMQYDNCVFLFMSSKDIYKFEEMLIEAKKSI